MLASGQVVADRYRVERTLGRGATATVYAATQLALNRTVALKVLDRLDLEEPAALERFERESRLQARLDHPGILPIVDAGLSDDGLFLVTKFIDGTTLRTLIQRAQLPPQRALDLLAQVAEALDHAHAGGFVHRDVKPHNVLVDTNDKAYLSDFGLARDVAAATITQAGTVFGTHAYVAPEVIRGEVATAASDRYSFAAMTFECLTGQVPFPRAVDAASLYAHTSEPAPALSAFRADLAKADKVLLSALDKSPSKRPTSARGLIDDIRAAVGRSQLDQLPPAPARDDEPVTPEVYRRPRPRPLRWLVPVLGVALVAGVVAFMTSSGEPSVDPPPVRPGAASVGSSLWAAAVVTLDCAGEPVSPGSPSCALFQETLGEATVAVPADGSIVAWHLRGATGTVRLLVLRQTDEGWYEAVQSADRVVHPDGVFTFTEDMRVLEGDRVGLYAAAGGAFGLASDGEGTIASWVPRPPAFLADSGLDAELLLRVDVVPGRLPTPPIAQVGEHAAAYRRGPQLAERQVVLDGVSHRVVLEQAYDGDVFLLRGDEPIAVFAPTGLLDSATIEVFEIELKPEGPVLVIEWSDPGVTGNTRRTFLVTAQGFERIS